MPLTLLSWVSDFVFILLPLVAPVLRQEPFPFHRDPHLFLFRLDSFGAMRAIYASPCFDFLGGFFRRFVSTARAQHLLLLQHGIAGHLRAGHAALANIAWQICHRHWG